MIQPHKDKLRAIVQAKQVDDLMAAGIKAAKRVSMKLWQRIAACWREGRMDFNLAEIFQSDLLDALSSACLQAHVKGFSSSTIQFDLYSETVGLLGDRATIDRLEQQYGVDCLRILSGAANNVEDALRAKMNELIEQGAHVRRGITELASTFAAQGVSPKNTFQLETIFRTQHQLAYGAGRWHADQDPDIQEILWGYKYVTVGDDRVRESHAKLDGVTMSKDDPFWQTHWPPNGWNCRCQAIPIYDERPTIAPPRGVDPDEGFAFNNGVVMSDLAAIDNPPVPDNYTPPAVLKIYVPPAPNVPPIRPEAAAADAGLLQMPTETIPLPEQPSATVEEARAGLEDRVAKMRVRTKSRLEPDDPEAAQKERLRIEIAKLEDEIRRSGGIVQFDKELDALRKKLAALKKQLDELWKRQAYDQIRKVQDKYDKLRESIGDRLKEMPPIEKMPEVKLKAIVGETKDTPEQAAALKAHRPSAGAKDAVRKWTALAEGRLTSPLYVTQVRHAEAGEALYLRYADDAKKWNRALDEMPKFKGTVYRGITVQDAADVREFTKVGGTVTLKSSSSASKKGEYAADYGEYVFRIQTKTGADISHMSRVKHAKEVVLRKGTKYKVTNTDEWQRYVRQPKSKYERATVQPIRIIDLVEV